MAKYPFLKKAPVPLIRHRHSDNFLMWFLISDGNSFLETVTILM
jgi:hypothetical protein